MHSERSYQQDDAPWLDQFSIFLTSRSDRIYNNGRQQIEVTVLMAPAQGHVVTDTQLRTLTLVACTEDGQQFELSDDTQQTDWFYRSAYDDRYDYYPALVDLAILLDLSMQPKGTRIKRFYIHSRAPYGQSITLAACISQGPQMRQLVSDHLLPALIAEPSPRYGFPDDYEWQRHVRVGDRLFDDAAIRSDAFICEYVLRPKQVAFSSGHFLPHASMAENLVRRDRDQTLADRATVVGVAFPGEATLAYAPHVSACHSLNERLIQQTLSPRNGQIVITVQGESRVDRTLEIDSNASPLRFEAFDRCGASHRLQVNFETAEERFSIQVEPVGTAQTEAFSGIAYFKVNGRGMPQDATACRLYNNGHQQTYLEVAIEAVDELGATVPLPADAREAITLVDYDTGALLGSSFNVVRRRSAKDQRFVYYPNQQHAAGTAMIDVSAERIEFFISTKSLQNRRVAARLVHNGKMFHTHDRTLPAGHGETVAGKTNSSAMVMPMAQEYFFNAQSDYEFPRFNAGDSRVSGVRDIDRYELRLKSAIHRLRWTNFNRSMVWDYTGNTITNWTYACSLSGQTKITAAHRDIAQPVQLDDSAVCYFRIKVDREWIEGEENTNVSFHLSAADEMGNPHTFWITTAEKMNLLHL